MPNRFLALLPSAFLISWRPQPDSCAAWPIMNAAGIPLCASAARAAAACCCTKSTCLCESGVAGAAAAGAPLAGAAGAASAADAPTPICRSSWRAIASVSPPGRPVIFAAYWLSSISVPSLVPSLSSIPELSVASRMLFINCCMKSASNCFAVSRMAAFGSRAAALRSSAIESAPLAVPASDESGGVDAAVMRPPRLRHSPLHCPQRGRSHPGTARRCPSDHLELGHQRAGGLHRLQDREQVLRRRAERVERLDHVGELGARRHLHQGARLLGDRDVGLLGDRGLAGARERPRLADRRR